MKHSLVEAIALIQLKDSDLKVRLAAVQTLGKIGSIPSRDFLTTLEKETEGDDKPATSKAVQQAQAAIESHRKFTNGFAAPRSPGFPRAAFCSWSPSVWRSPSD